jgi:hypothetical protein
MPGSTSNIGLMAAVGIASGISLSTFLYGESSSKASSKQCGDINHDNDKMHVTSVPYKKGQPGTNVRKRMTAIGKFSLRSQTESNPSQPTFFLALSNLTRDKSVTMGPVMTASEFKETWYRKDMHRKHPRFHSKVSSCGDFFEPINATDKNTEGTGTYVKLVKSQDGSVYDGNSNFDSHVSETLHMAVYRQDLKSRIEQFLTDVMDVTEKLWEVQISSGNVGTSGGISHKRSQEIYREAQDIQEQKGTGVVTIPKETIMLFRSHHSLADAVSIVAALGDLLDEAQEIKDKIKVHLAKQREKVHNCSTLQKLWKFMKTLIWFLFGSLQAVIRHGYLILTTSRNPFLAAQGLSNSCGDRKCGRSISWCDVASVDEVKRVAKIIGGPKTTVNDVFVSCVTAAVVKQLAEHRKWHKTCDDKPKAHKTMNVVIPAHLAGGILPPGREIGNLIGAFVANVPGELNESFSPSERLKRVHKSLAMVKDSPAPILSYLFAKFASNYLPESLAKALFLKSNANAAVAITNAKGYEEKVHINGRTVENMVGFYPLPPGLPVGVVVQSYGNIISLSITAEKWAVPDGDAFLGWILEEYRLLYAEASLKAKEME